MVHSRLHDDRNGDGPHGYTRSNIRERDPGSAVYKQKTNAVTDVLRFFFFTTIFFFFRLLSIVTCTSARLTIDIIIRVD